MIRRLESLKLHAILFFPTLIILATVYFKPSVSADEKSTLLGLLVDDPFTIFLHSLTMPSNTLNTHILLENTYEASFVKG